MTRTFRKVKLTQTKLQRIRAATGRANPDNHMLTEIEVLKDVSARFARAGIDYMLTGSMAMSYYAEPRMTRDIDIVVALGTSDAHRLRALFEPDYYVPGEDLERALAAAGMFNLVHIESVVKVDIIVRKQTPYRQAEFARRMSIDLPGFRTWIVSKEDLILSKLAWAGDSRSETQLRDVRNLLASGADLDYLRRWAGELGVAGMLEESLNE